MVRRERKYNIKDEDLGLWMNSCSPVWRRHYRRVIRDLQIDEAGVVQFCGCSPIYWPNI